MGQCLACSHLASTDSSWYVPFCPALVSRNIWWGLHLNTLLSLALSLSSSCLRHRAPDHSRCGRQSGWLAGCLLCSAGAVRQDMWWNAPRMEGTVCNARRRHSFVGSRFGSSYDGACVLCITAHCTPTSIPLGWLPPSTGC